MDLDNKKNRILFYKKNIMLNLNGLYSKVQSLFYSLDKADTDCKLLDDEYDYEFDSIMLELEIILSDVSKWDFSLDMVLNNNIHLLGNSYNDKLNDIKPKLKAINSNINTWKTDASKWIIPLFFNLLMKLDSDSILNNKSNSKEAINNNIMQKLKDELDNDKINYIINNDSIIVNDSNINMSLSSNLLNNNLINNNKISSNIDIDYGILDDLD